MNETLTHAEFSFESIIAAEYGAAAVNSQIEGVVPVLDSSTGYMPAQPKLTPEAIDEWVAQIKDNSLSEADTSFLETSGITAEHSEAARRAEEANVRYTREVLGPVAQDQHKRNIDTLNRLNSDDDEEEDSPASLRLAT